MAPASTMRPDLEWEPTRAHWHSLSEGELRFPQCESCGRFQWYPMSMCPQCHGRSFLWTMVQPRGTVHTFTIVHRPSIAGTEDTVPYAVVQVIFDDAPGVVLIANLADERDASRLEIGAPVDITFVTTPDGYTFPSVVPASAGGSTG